MKFIYILIFISLLSAISAELKISNIIDNKSASANINHIVDRSIPLISRFIVDNGLDPLDLPQTEKKLWMKLPYNSKHDKKLKLHKANLVLHSGILKHLSDLKRYGDATMDYKDKILQLYIGFEFKFLEVIYDYILKMLFFRSEGRILALTENVRAKFSVTFSIKNASICLNKFDLQVPSAIKVTIKNKNGKVSWIKTTIVKFIIPFVKDTLVNVIQKEGTKMIQKYLNEINNLFKNHDFTNNEIIDQYSQILIS
ncbi:hypothetical protein ALC62_15408 [Cyphomyrmex costatus]|uniref:Protein takeout n=1 Tax=Cyphomyrmex costatus TaxID=456900 RepID=A0A151I761_9HYME|nr:hypothetical protein ALC62_15408 [Cyphomyrmex costatus]